MQFPKSLSNSFYLLELVSYKLMDGYGQETYKNLTDAKKGYCKLLKKYGNDDRATIRLLKCEDITPKLGKTLYE